MKRFSWKKAAFVALCLILALILAALVAMTVYVQRLYDRMPTIDTQTMSPSQALEHVQTEPAETIPPEYTGEVLDPTDVTVPTAPAETIPTGDNIINILLVGQDRRSGQSRQRSDAMILCTINKANKTITLTSFMRDLYVYIPGYWNDRLNAAYVYGGFNTLNDALEYNFGVRSDYNVEVDFDGFEDAIDLVGGVDISLTATEAAYMNRQNSAWNMVEGNNHMTGAQALAYARNRSIGDDFGRTQRQRNVLTALIRQAMNLDLVQLNALAEQLLPMVATDMALEDISSVLLEVVAILPDMTIQTRRIPADGTYNPTYVGSAAVLIPDLQANQKILEEILGND